MALSPAQERRRTQLLARKGLRDTNGVLCAKLKLPILFESIQHETITTGLPAVLGGAKRAQKLTLTANQVIEVLADGCPTVDGNKGMQIEVYTTQEKAITICSRSVVIPAYKSHFISQDISKLPVQGAALLPPSDALGFRLKFSSEADPDTGRTLLELKLKPTEVVVMVIDREEGTSWAMHIDLKGLSNSLGISKPQAVDNQTE